MSAPDWDRVRSLFETAVELPAPRRARFLAGVCGSDRELHDEIEALLQAADEAGDFLEAPAVTQEIGVLPAPDPDPLPLPASIGAYDVIRRLGHGGMGVVYLARPRDSGASERVAVKVVKRGMDTETVVARFARERRILANLDHPNIARLLDGGVTDDGLPYFVMEYVDGEPIDAYCASRSLSVEARLALFRQVCEAVSHAHRHLVVHRDVKPRNILVTGGGTPCLLDFGLARVISGDPNEPGARGTVTAARMLTPEYASPEQVRGQPVTTASDVYSLGVTLYELLTGRRPYMIASHTPEEIAHAVCELPPERPPAAARLADDLVTILLMALRKEPQRRYQSVDALAEDIRRYLQGLPVTARKDTFRYRASKFIGRNRVGVAAAAVVALAVAAGITATVWQSRIANTERVRAERRYLDLRRLAGTLLFEFDEAIMDLPGSTQARELLVLRALEYLTALEPESAGDLSLQRELAEAYTRVGELQSRGFRLEVGDLPGALESFHKAMTIRQALVDASPDDLAEQDALAGSLLRIAQVMGAMCDPADDVQYARLAATIREVLVEAEPANRSFASGLAAAYETLGTALMRAEDRRGMLDVFTRLLALREDLAAATPADARRQCDLAEAHVAVGLARSLTNDPAAALLALERAEAIAASLVDETPGSERYQRVLMRIHTFSGGAHSALGERDDALAHLRHGVAIGERLRATDPSNADVRHRLAEAYHELGATLVAAGAREDAREVLAKARELLERWWRSSPANVEIAVTLAGVYEALGRAHEPADAHGEQSALRWRQAREWYQRSLDLWHDLAARDRLSPLYRPSPDRVAEALLRCDEALIAEVG